MKRSLFWLLDGYSGLGEAGSVYETAIEHAVEADALGFDALWLAEHHFRAIGTAPNPAVLLSAIAQRTSRIRLGPATAVLPLRDPIRLAEDYAMVDVLSKGRLNMGVGSGSSAAEFEPFGVDFDRRYAIFAEHLRSMRRRWERAARGERGTRSLNLAPVQSPCPPIFVASMSQERAFEIGRSGDSMLTLAPPRSSDLSAVAARLRAHARGLRAAGAPDIEGAGAVVMMLACLAETEAEARTTALPALARLMPAMTGTELSEPEALYEQMRGRGLALFGGPSRAEAQLRRMARLGVDHVAFITRFGGMSGEAGLRSLRLLAPAARLTSA